MTDTPSTSPRYDVVAIGNAIFDILAHVEDDFLVREKLAKGSMRLVDITESARLYNRIGQATRMSGGSAGNTAAAVASFGGKAAYVGKVSDDDNGRAYAHDMRGIGVFFDVAPLPKSQDIRTATSIILVTPDGERTMNTSLAACQELTKDDIDVDLIRDSAITYMEGYLWDPAKAKEAFRLAAQVAKEAGRKVSLTLSDAFCVDRYRSEFLDLVRTGQVDTLFANDHELRSLYETADLNTALDALAKDAQLGVVTLGEKGSITVTGDERIAVGTPKVDDIVDLTGAGDVFAGGYLFGLANDMPLRTCAELGHLAASHVIEQMGPRPQTSLKQLAFDAGILVEG
ncbi:MAG: adenosine kinase [Rhizobiales bacterium]|nr:adenosine kinase [Hyphomicrobiales bacterium]MBO6699407.1 adenosine kinase [Hyphomicrobiales bacterium]MBO6736945.1 adenosine kinase [Hyphomicrobiales bacterium]MBO6911981.1 adenosine kinase [Hyphomicrobiales bacterium]MBO6954651.1 adenosine kinase [Hyphomicrobiales bacterium]